MGRFSQYSRNADNAINRLTIADTALQSVTNLMLRAKELAIQAANDTFGAQDREALALELEEMKNEMFSVANSKPSLSGTGALTSLNTNTPSIEEQREKLRGREELKKFFNMEKMGIPIGAIRHKMTMDRIAEKDIK